MAAVGTEIWPLLIRSTLPTVGNEQSSPCPQQSPLKLFAIGKTFCLPFSEAFMASRKSSRLLLMQRGTSLRWQHPCWRPSALRTPFLPGISLALQHQGWTHLCWGKATSFLDTGLRLLSTSGLQRLYFFGGIKGHHVPT